MKGQAFLNVAKNRNGGLERIELRFKGELTKFVNPERNEALEARVEGGAPRHETAGEEPEMPPLPEESAPADDEEPPF